MIVDALVGTAAGLGVVHVLTGPDHLSAIATLSANVSTRRAFFLGLKWGCGHSLGLVVVGIILIAITVPTDAGEVLLPHSLKTFFECLVGVFMLLLGAYGIRHALKKRRAKSKTAATLSRGDSPGNDDDGSINVTASPGATPAVDADSAGDPSGVEAVCCTLVQSSFSLDEGDESGSGYGSSIDVEASVRDEPAVAEGGTDSEDVASTRHVEEEQGANAEAGNSDAALGDTETAAERERGVRACPSCCNCLSRTCDNLSAGVAALFLGILHGLAGSGGVLGVIPAVQLHDWKLATLYLGTFCLISTLVMGAFAATYGTASAKMTGSAEKREFIVGMFSSCLSIAVGIVWLVLSPLGKLDVFG